MTTKSQTVPTFNSRIEKVPLGEIRRDTVPSAKFPEGRIVLGIPTSAGGNQRGYMTVEEAQEQKDALVSTDPSHAAYGFKVTTKTITLKVGDLFQVAGKHSDQKVNDLRDTFPDTKEYPIYASPAIGCLTAWYERKPTIKAHLKIGDRVRIGRTLYKLENAGNDWVKLTPEAR